MCIMTRLRVSRLANEPLVVRRSRFFSKLGNCYCLRLTIMQLERRMEGRRFLLLAMTWGREKAVDSCVVNDWEVLRMAEAVGLRRVCVWGGGGRDTQTKTARQRQTETTSDITGQARIPVVKNRYSLRRLSLTCQMFKCVGDCDRSSASKTTRISWNHSRYIVSIAQEDSRRRRTDDWCLYSRI